jgi:hypothetical protein
LNTLISDPTLPGPNTLSFLSLSAITRIYGFSNALDKTTAYDVHSMNGEGLFFHQRQGNPRPPTQNMEPGFFRGSVTSCCMLPAVVLTIRRISQYHGSLVTEIQNLINTLLKRTRDNGDVDLVRIFPQYTYDTTVRSFQPLIQRSYS